MTTLFSSSASPRRLSLIIAVAAVALGAAGAVLAAFDVKGLPAALVVVAVAVVGVAGLLIDHRQHEREWAGQVSELLTLGLPLPRVQDVDPFSVGVFDSQIARAAARPGEEPPYVSRAADEALDKALVRARFVLVFAPVKAGKSRTAFQALRRVLSDHRLVVPGPGVPLRRLMELVPWRNLSAGDEVVFWLDDVDRWLGRRDGLDRKLLDELTAPDASPRVRVVATIRSERLEELTTDRDLANEAWRVLARAHSHMGGAEVRLSVELTDKERLEAASAYPQLRLFRLGRELAGTDELVRRVEARADEAAETGWALVRAAVDWERVGMRSVISEEDLVALARAYDKRLAQRPTLGAAALEWALKPVASGAALLERVGDEPASYAAFDFIVDVLDGVVEPHGRLAEPVGEHAWTFALNRAVEGDLVRIARSAHRRGAGSDVLAKVSERLGPPYPPALGPIPPRLTGWLDEYLQKMASHPDLPELPGRPLDLPVKQRTDLDVRIGLAPPDEAAVPKKLTVLEAIRSLQYCVLVGEPGSGKTTALKALADTLAGEFKKSLDRREIGQRQYLPVYLWLPHFDPVGATPSDRVSKLLRSAFQRVIRENDGAVDDVLRRFRLALLFDGLNEMDEADVYPFLDDLATFIEEDGDHVVVIASRTHHFEGRLGRYPFQVLQMLELEYPDGVQDFLARYLDGPGVRQVMARLQRESEDESERTPLRRLALNPLLLHMMARVYLHKKKLPGSRGHLLDKLARGLLGRWKPQARQSLGVGPDGHDCRECRHVLLRHLGYAMKRKGLELPVADVRRIFEAAADAPVHDCSQHALGRAARSSLPADWDDLIDELVRDSLLLQDSRGGRVRFWHQTFQEYFVACYVRDTLRRRLIDPRVLDSYLRPYIRDPTWHEVLAIVAGLLKKEEARRFIDRIWIRDRLVAARCLSNTLSYIGPGWTAWTQRLVTSLQRRIEWFGVRWQRFYPYLFVALLGVVVWLIPTPLIESLPVVVRHMLDVGPVVGQGVATALLTFVSIITLMLLFRLYVAILVSSEQRVVREYVQPGIDALRFIGGRAANSFLIHLTAVLADDFSIGNQTRATVKNSLLPRTRSIPELSMRLESPETCPQAIETLGEMGTPAALRPLQELLQKREVDNRFHTSALRELVRNAKLVSNDEPGRRELETLLQQQLGDETTRSRWRYEAYLSLQELGVNAQAPREGRWRALLTGDLLVPARVVRVLLVLAVAVVLAYVLSRCSGPTGGRSDRQPIRTDAVAVGFAFAFAFKVFIVGVVAAGVLDMLIMQRLRRWVPRFASHHYSDAQPHPDREFTWVRAAPVRFLMGASTMEFLGTRTIRFPLIELLFGGAILASASVHGPSVEFVRDVLYLLFAIPLMMISGLDPGRALTPNALTYVGTIVGLATSLLLGADGFVSALLGAGGAFALHFVLALLSPRGMGLGSVKAATMVGAFCGFPGTVVAIFGWFLTAGIAGLYMMVFRGRGQRDMIPLTPHIMVSGFVALLWSPVIID